MVRLNNYKKLVKTCEGREEGTQMKFVAGEFVCDFGAVTCDIFDVSVGTYQTSYIESCQDDPSRGLIICRMCAAELGLIW